MINQYSFQNHLYKVIRSTLFLDRSLPPGVFEKLDNMCTDLSEKLSSEFEFVESFSSEYQQSNDVMFNVCMFLHRYFKHHDDNIEDRARYDLGVISLSKAILEHFKKYRIEIR